jgi:hypothetical protein
VQTGAEGRRVDQPEGVWFRFHVNRDDPKTSDMNRAWAQNPDRSFVTWHRRRDRDVADRNGLGDLFWRDTVGHERRYAAVMRALDVERAEFDEAIERIGSRVAKVYSVRHGATSTFQFTGGRRSLVSDDAIVTSDTSDRKG